MAEFNGIPPVGINAIVRPAPSAPPPAVPDVEAGLKGGGLSGRMTPGARLPAATRTAADPDAPEQRRPRRDRDPGQIAGPSPAFQASVLELELDLQNTIARVEAARSKRESEIAGVTAGAGTEAGRDAARADEARTPDRPSDGPDEVEAIDADTEVTDETPPQEADAQEPA